MIDDIGEFLSKLPPIEKLFGGAWIITWFLAIWVYHIQFFLTGLFCLFLAILLLSYFDDKKKAEIPAFFSMDKNTRTLTVQKIHEADLSWDDHEICSGSAIIPSGLVREGDAITNCSGNVSIRHIPTNILIGAYNFE